jgi:hypothetical protein
MNDQQMADLRAIGRGYVATLMMSALMDAIIEVAKAETKSLLGLRIAQAKPRSK